MGKNYIDEIADMIAMELGGEVAGWTDGITLLRLYALLVLTKGTETISEDVHDAWSVWCAKVQPDHKSLLSWSKLPADVQELDDRYRTAIHNVTQAVRVLHRCGIKATPGVIS